MQTWDAIRARRNVRRFAGKPIDREDLQRILEAGRRTPSSMNTQRWDFVVVTERSELEDLSRVWSHAQHVATSAATVALVAPNRAQPHERESIAYDLGQVTMSMMIVAADLGIGSGHSAVADQDLTRLILGFPADGFCAYLIAFGYPADRPLRPIRNPRRRPFDDVVHWERW